MECFSLSQWRIGKIVGIRVGRMGIDEHCHMVRVDIRAETYRYSVHHRVGRLICIKSGWLAVFQIVEEIYCSRIGSPLIFQRNPIATDWDLHAKQTSGRSLKGFEREHHSLSTVSGDFP